MKKVYVPIKPSVDKGIHGFQGMIRVPSVVILLSLRTVRLRRLPC